MAHKNLIGENGGERKINPSANPVFSFWIYFKDGIWKDKGNMKYSDIFASTNIPLS